MRGWDATIYGCRVRDLVHALIEAARSTLDTHENRLMNAIAELWEVEMVPRDEFVTQEIRANRGW